MPITALASSGSSICGGCSPWRPARWRSARIGRGLALADRVEGALELVGEGGDPIEAEHRAGALDGVQGAERGVEQIGVARRVLEIEQRGLQLSPAAPPLLGGRSARGFGAASWPSTSCE